MKKEDRFTKNLSGISILEAGAYGLDKTLWYVFSSGSKEDLITLKDRRTKIFNKTDEWVKEGKLCGIDTAYFTWASIMHDNFLQIAEWLRKSLENKLFWNEGIVRAFLIYFVKESTDLNGKTEKITNSGRVLEIFENFKKELEIVTKMKPENIDDPFTGSIEYHTFMYKLQYGLATKIALKEVVKEMLKGKLG